MRRMLMSVLCGLTVLAAYAQDKPAYRIFTEDGGKTDYAAMI